MMLRPVYGGRVVRINRGEVIVCNFVLRRRRLILGIRIGESHVHSRVGRWYMRGCLVVLGANEFFFVGLMEHHCAIRMFLLRNAKMALSVAGIITRIVVRKVKAPLS